MKAVISHLKTIFGINYNYSTGPVMTELITTKMDRQLGQHLTSLWRQSQDDSDGSMCLDSALRHPLSYAFQSLSWSVTVRCKLTNPNYQDGIVTRLTVDIATMHLNHYYFICREEIVFEYIDFKQTFSSSANTNNVSGIPSKRRAKI